MKNDLSATICAPVTVRGRSAVAMIRISGVDAVEAVSAIFDRPERLLNLSGDRALHGKIVDAYGCVIDDVIATVFRAPRSFTGEDVVELGLHGSPLIVDTVIELLYKRGVRGAEPGEFTKRAFVNGKLSLTEAESVIDVIESGNRKVLDFAGKNLRGELDAKLNAYSAALLDIMAGLDLSIDFDEEALDETDWSGVKDRVTRVLEDMRADIKASRNVMREKDGISVVIMGAPNTGKSTLMNALLGSERVLVSDKAGTTRDFVSEALHLNGHRLELSDTAGLRRETPDDLERLGMEKTLGLLEKADLVLYMFDARGASFTVPDEIRASGVPVMACLNKIDLAGGGFACPAGCLCFSAATGEGIQGLKDALTCKADELTDSGDNSVVMLNRRQTAHLISAEAALSNAMEAAKTGYEELVADLLREAVEEMEMVTGKKVVDTVLDTIFSRFCLGK